MSLNNLNYFKTALFLYYPPARCQRCTYNQTDVCHFKFNIARLFELSGWFLCLYDDEWWRWMNEWMMICVCTVKVGNKHSCAVYGGQPVRTDVGFLPLSLTGLSGMTSTSGTAVGSVSCPWMIQMHRGQRVNLTLMNFNQPVSIDWLIDCLIATETLC